LEEVKQIVLKILNRRIPPKKTTQDYIDEFNRMFTLDEKKKIFGIEGKEIQMGQRNGGITRL